MSDVTAPLAVKVWGDFACFTRPELKVERVSYDVMTPSAARGVLEAVLQLRLNEEIREKQAIAYSPNASGTTSDTFKGYGYMAVAAETLKKKAK